MAESAYNELKDKFEHLQIRALQLFKLGQQREHELRTAVVNAHKYFDEIYKEENVGEIKRIAIVMRDEMQSSLNITA